LKTSDEKEKRKKTEGARFNMDEVKIIKRGNPTPPPPHLAGQAFEALVALYLSRGMEQDAAERRASEAVDL